MSSKNGKRVLFTGPQAIMQRLWRYRQLGSRACLLQSDVAASQMGFAHSQEEISSSAASHSHRRHPSCGRPLNWVSTFPCLSSSLLHLSQEPLLRMLLASRYERTAFADIMRSKPPLNARGWPQSCSGSHSQDLSGRRQQCRGQANVSVCTSDWSSDAAFGAGIPPPPSRQTGGDGQFGQGGQAQRYPSRGRTGQSSRPPGHLRNMFDYQRLANDVAAARK